MPKIYILNTTIMTTPGLTYRTQVIGVREARSLVFGDLSTPPAPGSTTVFLAGARPEDVVSAIGHESTAAIASEVLGRLVPVNRVEARMQPGDIAVAIKLRGRAPEGVILTREQIEAIGFDLIRINVSDPAAEDEHARQRDTFMEWLALPDHVGEGEQPRNTRQRGTWPVEHHFIVRLDDGSRHWLTCDCGTLEWRSGRY
jgi:hypothetical protein